MMTYGFVDPQGADWIVMNDTVQAVNALVVQNAATGAPVVLSPGGQGGPPGGAAADANAGITLRAAGTGTVTVGAAGQTVAVAGTITMSTPVGVASGGTGRATLTNHGVLVGAGTAAVTQLAVGASNSLLQGTTGADPAFTTTPTVASMTVTSTLTLTGAAVAGSPTWSNPQTFPAGTYGAEPQVNLLTNGGFEIWQRGNGPYTANNAYTADRWTIFLNGTDTISVSKDTTHQDTNSSACAAITFTLGSGGGSSEVYQKQEDFAQLKGQPISFSLRVNQSVANACKLVLEDGVSSYAGSTSAVTGSYVTLTVTATLATNANTVQVDLRLLASATIYVDNAMLVVGSAPINYVPLTPAEEWARCQRYYEVVGGTASIEPAGAVGLCTSTTGAAMSLRYVRKAVAPTVTVSANSDWAVLNSSGSLVTLTAFSAVNIGLSTCVLTITVASGLVAGNATYLAANSTTNARLILEANP